MMKKTIMDLNSIKVANRSVLLKILSENGPMSRKDISELSGLSAGAITIISNELLNEGIIKEVGHADSTGKAGRKKILIDIEKKHKYILGINIEKERISLAISDLDLNIIIDDEFDMENDIPPEELFLDIVEKIKDLLWKMDISKSNVLGIGVGVVGRVDPVNGISMEAYDIWNEQVPIKDLLERSLKIPVVVDNNVRALALAEIYCSEMKDLSDFIFLKHGPGLGAAIVINRKLLYGFQNMAGEIGHIIVDPEGPECGCGQRGCLETLISTRRLKKEIKENFNETEYPVLYKLCNGEKDIIRSSMIFRAFELGEEKIIEKIQKNLIYLSVGIISIMKTVDPEKIIFFGDLFKHSVLIEQLKKTMISQINDESIGEKLITSCLEYRSPAIGSLAIALERLFYETGAIYKSYRLE